MSRRRRDHWTARPWETKPIPPWEVVPIPPWETENWMIGLSCPYTWTSDEEYQKIKENLVSWLKKNDRCMHSEGDLGIKGALRGEEIEAHGYIHNPKNILPSDRIERITEMIKAVFPDCHLDITENREKIPGSFCTHASSKATDQLIALRTIGKIRAMYFSKGSIDRGTRKSGKIWRSYGEEEMIEEGTEEQDVEQSVGIEPLGDTRRA